MSEGVFETGFNGLKTAQPSLPSDWYWDESQYRRELKAIWHQSWLYLCRGDAIAPGSFRAPEIAGQRIVVVRDSEGVLRGFFNTCRHRGSILCTEEEGTCEKGLLTCPYHQWAYDLTGRLRATGMMRPVAEFDRAEHSLHPVAVTEWRGCVFINLAGDDAEDFTACEEEFENIARWPLDGLVTGHRYRAEIACNWKIFWENFNECLHCPAVHSELSDLVPIYKRAIMVRKDDPDWQVHADSDAPVWSGALREGAETWSTDGKAQGVLPDLGEAERAAGQAYGVAMPSVFMAAHLDYVRITRLLPLGPERMELSAEWLFDPGMLADPGFDASRITDFATMVMDQDSAACELNQAGLRNGPFKGGVLMQEEYEVFAFHEWVRARLGEPLRAAPAGSRASRRKLAL